MKKVISSVLCCVVMASTFPVLANEVDSKSNTYYEEYLQYYSQQPEGEYKLTKEEVQEVFALSEAKVREIEEDTQAFFANDVMLTTKEDVMLTAKENDKSLENLFFFNKRKAIEIRREAGRIQQSESNYAVGVAKSKAYKYRTFASLVRSGGAWDIKSSPLNPRSTYLWRSQYRTGEFIGNYHYGYMGVNVGIDSNVLRVSAGVYQILSGTSDWSYWRSYFDDPADQVAINFGISEAYINF